jgi:DNA-binding response OmpR family regulator
MKPRNVLCIDNEDTCQLYDSLFSTLGKNINLVSPTNLQEAINLVKSRKFDLFILEPHQPGFNGIEFCKFIRENNAQSPIVVYSGMSREIDRIQGLAAGANAYFIKPADFDKFIETIEEFLN